jgi:dipeptidyl-peptidase-4
MLLLAAHAASATEDAVHPSELTLERIFEEKEFRVERYGPARWLEDGSGYTTLEASEGVEEAKDIVRYDPATGERSVVVPATSLLPTEGEEPLVIKDYLWSEDGKRLLIFTNTERVWRRNTRGDYWVLSLEDGKLQQLGGGAEESSIR